MSGPAARKLQLETSQSGSTGRYAGIGGMQCMPALPTSPIAAPLPRGHAIHIFMFGRPPVALPGDFDCCS